LELHGSEKLKINMAEKRFSLDLGERWLVMTAFTIVSARSNVHHELKNANINQKY